MAAMSDTRTAGSEPVRLNVGLAGDPESSGIEPAEIRNFGEGGALWVVKTDFLRGVKRERGSPGLLGLLAPLVGWQVTVKGLLSLVAGRNGGA